jgi:diguanylate cyclase (GGDEF)-like protein
MLNPATMKVLPVASAGMDEVTLAAIERIMSSPESAPRSMIARAMKDRKAVVANSSESDPQALLRTRHGQAGVRSVAVLPLIVSNEAIGVLALYADKVEFFHEEELKLLRELVSNISFALAHIEQVKKLDYLAYYDLVTGLASHALFLERLQEKLHLGKSDEHKKAVFVLDIERFKQINDAFGREAGDQVLKQIAERLVQLGGGDASRFARIGPDRFAIVAGDMDSVEQVGRYTEQRLYETFHKAFQVRDNELRISAKVGIALFPDDGEDADALLRNAEAALKKAKRTGERYLFFTQAMTARVAERLSLENKLRQALDNEEFVLHYQPKVSLESGKLTGAEALIRWNDPRTGLVPPAQFIPILEETGLIHDVGRWALRKALEDYLRWRAADLPVVRIAVNVSPLQLRHRDFIAEIGRAIGIESFAGEGLEIEITESLVMEDVKRSVATLQALRDMAVTTAIDDFGTGFSSLSYLAKLPVDTLKIDRSFVVDMAAGPQGVSLVSTIIALAHSLKLKVVAEGVETEEQSRLLRSLNCDEMQGYLFSKPIPGEVFETTFLRVDAD